MIVQLSNQVCLLYVPSHISSLYLILSLNITSVYLNESVWIYESAYACVSLSEVCLMAIQVHLT